MTMLPRLLPSVLLLVLLASGAGVTLSAQQQPTVTEPQSEFVPISQLPAQDQLPAAPLLVGAYAFVLGALFVYLLSVARRLQAVQHEVERLETDLKRGGRV